MISESVWLLFGIRAQGLAFAIIFHFIQCFPGIVGILIYILA